MNIDDNTTNNTTSKPIFENGKYRCHNCNSELNNDELSSGRCFSCNTQFEFNNKSDKDIDHSVKRNRILFISVIAILLILVLIKFITSSEDTTSNICAIDSCNNEAVFGSIYCEEHRNERKGYIPATNESVISTEITTETTTIPVASYVDIKSGTYNNQTIKIEGILGNINVDSISVCHASIGWICKQNRFAVSWWLDLYVYGLSNKYGNHNVSWVHKKYSGGIGGSRYN